MRYIWWLGIALLISPIAHAQDREPVQPAGTIHNTIRSVPAGVTREVAASARDFATFRDPQWSILTIAQIGAASADEVTSRNVLRNCLSCRETGIPRFVVGSRPDAHKYVVAGVFEIGIEAVAARYFRNHGPTRKWYWRALWTLPQSFFLYEHARAARDNSSFPLACYSSSPPCH